MPSSSPTPPPAAPNPVGRPPGWLDWVDAGLRDPHWAPRAALVGILGWFFLRHLTDPAYRGIYGGLNLVVHEAGHALFSWSGSTVLTIAGGTVLEVAVPLLVGVLFWRQRDPFAVTVAGFWLATVALDVSVYVGDARSQLLPLVTVGSGPPVHDWGYLLGEFDLLRLDTALARVLRRLGLVFMAASLGAGGWVVHRIRRRVGSDRR